MSAGTREMALRSRDPRFSRAERVVVGLGYLAIEAASATWSPVTPSHLQLTRPDKEPQETQMQSGS